MEFNFTGDSRPVRQINLGGQSGHGQSAAQLAAAARAERAARGEARKRNAAAAYIQSSFRGTKVARAVRLQLATRFDQLASLIEQQQQQKQQRQQTTLLPPPPPSSSAADSADPNIAALVESFVELTRLLVFSVGRIERSFCEQDAQRLTRWCRIVCSPGAADTAAPPLLAVAFSRPTTPSDHRPETSSQRADLVLLVCGRMLAQVSRYALLLPAEASVAYFDIFRTLTSPDPSNPLASTTLMLPKAAESVPLVEYALRRLLNLGLHRSLQRFVLSFPVNRKASPAMGPALSLSLAPFRVFKAPPAAPHEQHGNSASMAIVVDDAADDGDASASPRQRAVQSFCTSILTIPLLSNRIPLASVTELAAAFPFSDVVEHISALGAFSVATGDSALDDNPLHSPYFLANFLAFGAVRVAHLKDGKAVRAYLEALTVAQDALPSQVFLSPEEWRLQSKNRNGDNDNDHSNDGGHVDGMPVGADLRDVDMSDGSAAAAARSASTTSRTVMRAPPTSSTSPSIPAYTLPLDAQTHKRLGVLVSETHLSALLSASGRYPTSTRQALCCFLCSTLVAWPASSRERVFNTIMYGYVQPMRNAAAAPVQAAKGAAGQLVGGFVRELWRGQVRGNALARTLASAGPGLGARETLATLADPDRAAEWPAFVLLCELYSRCLLTIGDDEFYPPSSTSTLGGGGGAAHDASSTRNPLTLDEVISLSAMLRNIAFAMYWHEGSGLLTHLDGDGPGAAGTVPRVPGMKLPLLSLRNLLTKLLQQLHARDSRRRFTPEGHWLMLTQHDLQSFIQTVILEERELNGAAHQSLPPETDDEVLGARRDSDDIPPLPVAEQLRWRRTQASNKLSARNLAFLSPRLGVLNNIPFVIPFDVRVEIFRQFVAIDAQKLGLARTPFSTRQRIRVRRGMIAEDGFAQMNPLGPRLKERLEITFIDRWGMEEAGIDGGGVYKEFLTSLVREAFDTNRGLWKATDAQELYPNPHSYAKAPDQLEWYTFLGRVLGKALYEGILVDIKFASFFLSKWLGKQGYLDDLASLDSLDRELYRGLIYLKNYPGDVETDLALNFTVTDDEFGVSKTTELVPSGSEVPVTRENRLEYIYRVSHYRLSVQIAEQCQAFFRGLSEMIDARWLRMMNREELRVLVCGTEEPIDVADLRANTVYGGYHEKDVAVEYFWQALESFDQPQRKAFLKFVTSSPNPPLLGFGELYPKFSIRNAGNDATRLPTASTCVNLLKLPEYQDAETCRQKLIYAIQSGAGFDLS